MKNNQKILIGILFVLLTAGCIEETQNLEFEFKIYNETLFSLNIEYKQYFREGKVDERIKKVFADNKIFLSDDAKMSICENPDYWEIKDGKITYVIGPIGENPLTVIDRVNGGYLKDIRWINDTLIINAVITARCGGENFRLLGNYKLDGDTIHLVVSETSIPVRCMTYYNVTFKIKNLQKKDYKILLYTDVMGQGKLLIDEKII